MIIPKAIEILELNLNLASKKIPQDAQDSVSLAIEALKVIDKARSRGYSFASILLPGEDPE